MKKSDTKECNLTEEEQKELEYEMEQWAALTVNEYLKSKQSIPSNNGKV